MIHLFPICIYHKICEYYSENQPSCNRDHVINYCGHERELDKIM